MKIANRLRFSSVTMVAATVAIGSVAVSMMATSKSSVSSTQRYFAADGVLEAIGSDALAYYLAAANIAASGTVKEEDQGGLKELEDKIRESAKKLGGAEAAATEKAVDTLVEGTGSVLEDVRAAQKSGGSGTKRRAVKPVPAKAPAKKGKAARPPPSAEEEPAPSAETEAVTAELESATTQLEALKAGRNASQQLEALHKQFTEAVSKVIHDLQASVQKDLTGAQSRTNTLIVLLALFVGVTLGVLYLMFRGFKTELLRPLELLAQGARRVSTERDLTVRVPVSGDEEIRDLGRAFGEMMETLRGITIEMRGATDRLLSSATELGGITRAQGESIARQASALEEARRTSSALRESSRDTVGQAEGVLRVAQKAESLGRDGESAMTENLSSAEVIRDQTRQVVDRIARLATSAQRIAAITATVKDLADQSNVVALNAAIEASRAGEAGVGFGVVAREIRSLADRSIRATIEVRTVLAEVLNGIKESAAIVEAAHAGLEEGTGRTRRLGDAVAGLTGIVRENLGAVREISGAVASQGTGIGQISNAVEDLSLMMEETLKTVHTTGEAASVLREVSEQVSSAVKVFRL